MFLGIGCGISPAVTGGASATPALAFTSAPTLTPSSAGVGGVFTASLGTVNDGTVTPVGVLTLDGSDVTGDMSGLTYTSDTAGDLVWTVTATKGAEVVQATASATVTAATATAQTASFGALTPAGAGAWKPHDANGDPIDLASYDSLSSGSLGSYTPSISGAGLRFTGGGTGAPDGAVLLCTGVDAVQYTITVSEEAATYSAAGLVEAETAYRAASVDQTIRLRAGSLNSAGVRWRFERGDVPSGAVQGITPEFSTYVTLTKDTGANVVIGALEIGGQGGAPANDFARHLKIEGLTFRCPFNGDSGGLGETGGPSQGVSGALELNGGSEIAVVNCDIGHGVIENATTGAMRGLDITADRVWIDGNRIVGARHGLAIGNARNSVFKNNTCRYVLSDSFTLNKVTGSEFYRCWSYDKLFGCSADYTPTQIDVGPSTVFHVGTAAASFATVGEGVYFDGFTGDLAAVLNGKPVNVLAKDNSAGTVTIAVDTTGLVADLNGFVRLASALHGDHFQFQGNDNTGDQSNIIIDQCGGWRGDSRGNVFSDGQGLYFGGDLVRDNITITNCMLEQTPNNGIYFGGRVDNLTIDHCTVIRVLGQDLKSGSSTPGIRLTAGGDTISITNNIVCELVLNGTIANLTQSNNQTLTLVDPEAVPANATDIATYQAAFDAPRTAPDGTYLIWEAYETRTDAGATFEGVTPIPGASPHADFVGTTPAAPNYTGSVDVDGFRFTFAETAPTEFEPITAPETYSVTRGAGGYDATGAAVTVVDDIRIAKRMRQRYPNEASLEASQAAMESVLYSGDTATGITNNSTRAVERVLHGWVSLEDVVFDGSEDITIQWVAAHKLGRNGTMVATSEVTIDDGSTTLSSGEKSAMTGTYVSALTGLQAPCYEHTFTAAQLATLSNGSITVDAIHKPWVGALWQASVDGSTYPSPYTDTIMRFTKVAAFRWFGVNADGATGTPGQQTTQAAALSNAYGTLQAAMAAAKSGDITGVKIVIQQGTTAKPTLNDELYNAGTQTGGAVEIIGSAANTEMNDTGSNDGTMLPPKLILRDITLLKTASGNYAQMSNRADQDANMASNYLGFELCNLDANGNGSSTLYFTNVGRCTFVETQVTSFNALDGDNALYVRAIGSTQMVGDNFFLHFASQSTSAGIRLSDESGSSKMVKPDPSLFWYSDLPGNGNANGINTDGITVTEGVALVGCISEHRSTDGKVAHEVSTDFAYGKENVWYAHCTVSGTELGWKYDNVGDGSQSTPGELAIMNSVAVQLTIQTDLDSKASPVGVPDGGRGAWEEGAYFVGSAYNLFYSTATLDPITSTSNGSWRGIGITWGDQMSPAPDFVDDKSYTGDNAGGGDYRLTTATAAQVTLIPAAKQMVPHDIQGVALSASGALPGAYQTTA